MNAIEILLARRARHLSLGYTAEIDKEHYAQGELARAALAMLLIAELRDQRIGMCDVDLLAMMINPWHNTKQLLTADRGELLAEACALLLGELERVQPVPASPDDRPSQVILTAIGDFARATGNVSRIADPEQRLKVLSMLQDFARHLLDQIAAELSRVVQHCDVVINGHCKPKEEN